MTLPSPIPFCFFPDSRGRSRGDEATLGRAARGVKGRISGIGRAWSLLFFVFLASISAGRAQEVDVTSQLQLELLTKILPFNNAYKQRVEGIVTIGIVYQKRNRASVLVKEDLMHVIEQHPMAWRKQVFRAVPIEYENDDILASQIDAVQPDILYITPMRLASLDGITSRTESRKIMTFTGVAEYVSDGISVGIGREHDRPVILVNLRAAKAEGVDFSSRLLQLAKVIR
jgi:hypothetical protein